MKDKFIEFLKEHNAYEKFVNNLKAICNTTIDELCTDDCFTEWIGVAFDWSLTPEGKHYWQNLDNLYCEKVLASHL